MVTVLHAVRDHSNSKLFCVFTESIKRLILCHTQKNFGNFYQVNNFEIGNFGVLFVKCFTFYGYTCVIHKPTTVKSSEKKIF